MFTVNNLQLFIEFVYFYVDFIVDVTELTVPFYNFID